MSLVSLRSVRVGYITHAELLRYLSAGNKIPAYRCSAVHARMGGGRYDVRYGVGEYSVEFNARQGRAVLRVIKAAAPDFANKEAAQTAVEIVARGRGGIVVLGKRGWLGRADAKRAQRWLSGGSLWTVPPPALVLP